MCPNPIQEKTFMCTVVIHSANGSVEVHNFESDPELIVSIQEYRDVLGDDTSTDEQIKKKVDYLSALFRTVIRSEIEAARILNKNE